MERATLGIDGGGSGSRARIRLPGGAVFEAEAGPANAFSDLDGAAATLSGLIEEVTRRANWQGACVIVAGVAGCRLPDLAEALADKLPRDVVIHDDSVTALKGALGARDGVLISLGTGSFFARQKGGHVQHIGGWGFSLGDTASAAWMGREAVRAALRAEDGQSAHDDLTKALLEATKPHPLTTLHGAAPADFAALCPLILQHKTSATAEALLRACWQEITSALSALGAAPNEAIVLQGGLAEALIPLLPADLAARRIQAAGSPLDGAMALAEALP